ncbi:MAG: polysaccharide biosynthesis/export family protein [Pseudomonadota bacterium]
MKYRLTGALLATVMTALAGCGAIYVSPDVPLDDPNVTVVPLTPQAIKVANFDPYQPKTLPAVFFASAGVGSVSTAVPPTPQTTLERPLRPGRLELNPPPRAIIRPYRIGVGDVLILSTPQAGSTVEQLTGLLAAQNRRQGYTVQGDGAIAIPDVGRINVASLTLEEAEAAIFQALVARQIDPSFSVEISEFNSQRITIGGGVARPTVVPVGLMPRSLEEVIAAAGGIILPDEDFSSIRIYRQGQLYQIPLNDYYRDGDLQKILLEVGDSIFVDSSYDLDRAQAYFQEQITLAQFRQDARAQALAELNAEMTIRRGLLDEERANFQARLAADAINRDYVYLTGEVSAPSRFTLPFGRQASLSDALYSQGGFSNQTGNPAEVYLLRGTAEGGIDAFHLNLANAANQVLATSFQMRPNDVIFVAEQPITRWNRSIQQIFPTLLSTAAATNN